MPIQLSGVISIQDLVTEFGGTAPHSLNAYYRGGPLVPNVSINNAIPTSGPISLNQFYGATVTPLFDTGFFTLNAASLGLQVGFRAPGQTAAGGSVSPSPLNVGGTDIIAVTSRDTSGSNLMTVGSRASIAGASSCLLSVSGQSNIILFRQSSPNQNRYETTFSTSTAPFYVAGVSYTCRAQFFA
jgi:hypothetical protein